MVPDVFVHGDPHLGNLVAGGDRSYLIDWEDAGWGNRMVDLGNVVTAFNRTEKFTESDRAAFWDGYGGRVNVPAAATYLHDVSRLIWAGSLVGGVPGSELGYEESKLTLDDPTGTWYPSDPAAS